MFIVLAPMIPPPQCLCSSSALTMKPDLMVLTERRKLGLVFSINISKAKSGSGLLVNNGTESSLSLNNTVWDTHLFAEGWEPEDDFNWVDIISNNNELGLLGFN